MLAIRPEGSRAVSGRELRQLFLSTVSTTYKTHNPHLQTSFHRLTRTAYLYNGCLAWYNVILTSRVHTVKRQQSQLRFRATYD